MLFDGNGGLLGSNAGARKATSSKPLEVIMTVTGVNMILLPLVAGPFYVILSLDSLNFLLVVAGVSDTDKWYYLILRGICITIALFENFVTVGATLLCSTYLFQLIESCLMGLTAFGWRPRENLRFGRTKVTSKFLLRLGTIRDEWAVYQSIQYLLTVAREQMDFMVAVCLGIGLCLSVGVNYCVIRLHEGLPAMFYFAIVVFSVIVPAFMILELPKASFIRDVTRRLLAHWKKRPLSKLRRRKLRALKPDGFRVGIFYELDMSTVAPYFDAIIDHTVTVILSF
jgi:hypothetical protein